MVQTKAEEISRWAEEIQALVFANHLWECVVQEHAVPLSGYFVWDYPTERVLVEYGLLGKKILPGSHPLVRRRIKVFVSRDQPFSPCHDKIADGRDKAPEQYATWTKGDLLGPAMLYLTELINEKLNANTDCRIPQGSRSPQFVAKNLLGAIWLQFSQIVSGEVRLKRCAVCKLYMDVTDKRSTWTKHESCAKRGQMRRYRRNSKG